MAIGTAVERGNTVYVYDESGRVLFCRSGTLVGYTGSTVSIKPNSTSTYVYDDKGHLKFVR
ncbi:MAG: hypothetical protein IKZ34_01110 [Alphaproteobacteria bacterium]|nr:hypothetical protein [Alphaproteobacteria bacterium]